MTNATLRDVKNISALVDAFDSFKISVDGSEAARHDFYRGQESFNRTLAAIELIERFSG